ncbi:MAG: acyl-CoA dehydrogenase family protein [Micromonosporaceae bacterium]
MRLTLSSEQSDFATAVASLLADADVPAAVRAWARGDHAPGLALWRRLAEVGVTALAIPEEYDGLGASPVEVVVAFEELGRYAVPGPLVESLVAVPALLGGAARSTRSEPAARWLPGIAAGKTVATLALPPHVPYALDAEVADPVLIANQDGVRLARVGAAHSSIDRSRRLYEVTGGVAGEGGTGRVSGEAGPGGRVLDAGALACAAQLLGLGGALRDAAVSYAKQRHQFGRPIGAFQAVKHQLADVHVGLELARPLVYGAAVTGAPRDISAAKVAAGEAAYRAARVALQVHGAIGYTAEHDLSLWLTKVRALRSAWGTPRHHRARILEGSHADR